MQEQHVKNKYLLAANTNITIELNHIKNKYLPAAMKNKYSKCKSPSENHVEVWLSLGACLCSSENLGAYLCSSETLHRHHHRAQPHKKK